MDVPNRHRDHCSQIQAESRNGFMGLSQLSLLKEQLPEEGPPWWVPGDPFPNPKALFLLQAGELGYSPYHMLLLVHTGKISKGIMGGLNLGHLDFLLRLKGLFPIAWKTSHTKRCLENVPFSHERLGCSSVAQRLSSMHKVLCSVCSTRKHNR